MKKQVLMRYKWTERGEEKWLFWLKKKLEALYCEVLMLPMTSDDIHHSNWVGNIQAIYDIEHKDTYYIEHDPGCLTILKYVERLMKIDKPEPALLVAGFDLLQGKRSERTDIQIYDKAKEGKGEDIRLVVIYGGSLGKILENPATKLLAS